MGTARDVGDRRATWLFPLVVITAGLWAYVNSFTGAFVFDDKTDIVDNRVIRQLVWPWQAGSFPPVARPLVDFSLALNYALGKLDVRGYHAVNLAIHLTAALVLYGLVRRTLAGPPLSSRVGASAPGLALAVALLFVVHPLQTQSVTYLIQRAESLMGLCYVLTLYSVRRGADSRHPRRWDAAAMLACAAGMASKAVMVTAPVVVALYDVVFLTRSWRQSWRARRVLYLGLAATWGLFAWLFARVPPVAEPSAGFAFKGITPLAYAATQPGVILHYLCLALWPHPLIFDYAWPVAKTVEAVLLPSVCVAGLVGATLWALRRHPPLGFLGAWVFLILAPSSSVIPIRDPAVEHRMNLPLAGVLTLVVLSAHRLLQILLPLNTRVRRDVAMGLIVMTTLILGTLTIQRNRDYRSEEALWRDTIAKRPTNPRAYSNLGNALTRQGKFTDAIRYHNEALRIDPNFADAHNNLGFVLFRQGQFTEAIPHYEQALRIQPNFTKAHNNLGVALAKQGKLEEAIVHYTNALRLRPDFADAHNNLGAALAEQGALAEAVSHYREALRLSPWSAEFHNNLAAALARQGDLKGAGTHYAEALRLKPDYANAHYHLGNILLREGKLEEAEAQFSEALRLNPNDAGAQAKRDLIRNERWKAQGANVP